MASVHAHINPGYNQDYEQSICRAQNKSPLLDARHHPNLNDAMNNKSTNIEGQAELDSIKNWAKRTWSRPDLTETTYQFQYPEKQVIERAVSVPTEGERKNKPHPKPVFLTNRLHYVPGYHNADTTIGRGPYRVDASCHTAEQDHRQGIRSKYTTGPTSASLRPFAPRDEEDIMAFPRALPPNDSWMASSSYCNRPGIIGRVSSAVDSGLAQNQMAGGIASHQRFLQMAGAEEREKIKKAMDSHMGDPEKVPNMMIPHKQQGTLASQRQRDVYNLMKNPKKALYRYPKPRGDFLIHPVWPPSIWHHRIPGFKATPPSELTAYEKHRQKTLTGVY